MNELPHDQQAEEASLGAMLLSPLAVDVLGEMLTPSDFYIHLHQRLFTSMVKLRNQGNTVDPITVADDLKGELDVSDKTALVVLQSKCPSVANARHYGQLIVNQAIRRNLIHEARSLEDNARDQTLDVMETLETHQISVNSLGPLVLDYEPDDRSVVEFVEEFRKREPITQWVIPGIIRRRHKLILVGAEGGSKSWMLRFVALCAAYGVTPFRHQRVKPIRIMILDAENPDDALAESFEAILKQVKSYSPEDEVTARLWWRPAGLNLRNRVDAAEFENLIKVRRPDLVCMGPLYTLYETSSQDFGWETAAKEVQRFLKKMMHRYDFALMIEDHAPQDRMGGMRPYGSSLWRRWPDIGLGMEPLEGSDEGAYRLNRWRGERVPTDWPRTVRWGSRANSPWPFVGEWGGEQDNERF